MDLVAVREPITIFKLCDQYEFLVFDSPVNSKS